MSNARRIADLLDSSGDVLGTNLDNVTTYSVGDGGLTTNDFTDADHTKLNAIEASATADQTGAEIKTAYEAEANAYTDTKDTKLSGIATSANNYSHPSGAGNSHIPTGGSVDQLLTNTASGTGTWQDAPVSLPSQTGNANKQLTTDGSTASWADTSITLDAPSITGTLFVDDGSTVSHTISNWSDDVSYTITPTNCTVGAVNSSGVFVVTHTSGTPSYTIVATTDSLGLADSSVVTKNIVLSVAMTAPSLNAPADSDDATAVTYTISSIDSNATKVIFDAQSSNFTYGSVGSGSGSKVGNTVEITGWSGTSVTVTLTYTTVATYSNRAKVQSTNAAYTDSAWSSTDSIVISSSFTATDNFDVSLWTGNGSSQSVTTGFQPDFVLYKVRSTTYDWYAFDSIRGATKVKYVNKITAEVTNSSTLTSFNSNGFSLGSEAGGNQNSLGYVGWSWKAGGTGVSNTNGSITSTVSVNTAAGFSIVSFTGTGSTATVGHGLSSTPDIIMVANRSVGGHWNFMHSAVNGHTGYMYSDGNGAFGSPYTPPWNGTAPTNSYFTVGNDSDTNGSASAIIAYCWHEVSGYSKFGSFTGNGSSTGPTVTTGFQPSFVLIKDSTQGGHNWSIWDDVRSTSNTRTKIVKMDSTVAEYDSAAVGIDFLSTGFQPKNTDPAINKTGNTYIYMAFA